MAIRHPKPKFLNSGNRAAYSIVRRVKDDFEWKSSSCESMNADKIKKNKCKLAAAYELIEEYSKQIRRCTNLKCYSAIQNKISKLLDKISKLLTPGTPQPEIPNLPPPPIPANVSRSM